MNDPTNRLAALMYSSCKAAGKNDKTWKNDKKWKKMIKNEKQQNIGHFLSGKAGWSSRQLEMNKSIDYKHSTAWQLSLH